MFDFPSNATVGQIVTNNVSGASWQWDGVKWGPPQSGGWTDAPNDGATYARRNNAWSSIDTTVNAAPNNTGRNLIHNPLFNVAQRGAGPFTAGNAFCLDRWFYNFSAGSMSVASTNLSDSDRAGIGDGAASAALNTIVTGNAAATHFSILQQRTEDVRRLAGKTVTASFYANATIANFRIGISIDQVLGTGSELDGNGQVVTLAATPLQWGRYSATFTVPSLAGQTITQANSCTTLNIWLSAGTNFTTRSGGVGQQSGQVNIWGVQLEIGSVATPLEKPDPQQDLANCQRFYARVDIYAVTVCAATGHSYATTATLPVEMRTIPSVVFSYNGNLNLSGAGIQVTRPNTVSVYGTATAAGTTTINCTVAASADL